MNEPGGESSSIPAPEKAPPPPERGKILSLDQATVLYNWQHVLNGTTAEGEGKQWEQVENDFTKDPLVRQMHTWALRPLSEEEFWHLVFYRSPDTEELYQDQPSRLLRDASKKAATLRETTTNPYLQRALANFAVFPNPRSAPYTDPVFVRETIGEDEQRNNGSYYIHDGNRRMLGYATHLTETGEAYTPIMALVGTRAEEATVPNEPKPPLIVKGFKERQPIPQEEILDTFKNADQLYFVVPEKIGDCVMGMGFVQSVLELEAKMGLGKKQKTILAPLAVHTILKPTLDRLGINLLPTHPGSGTNKAEYFARDVREEKAVVFDLDSNGGGDPEGLYFGPGQLTIKNMLPSILERHTVKDAGIERQRKYIADLFGVDEQLLDPLQCQPRIDLPHDSKEAVTQLIEKYHIDTTKPQIAILVETSEPGRQYDIAKWCETARLLTTYYPEAEFNILYDGKKRPDDETFIDRASMEDSFKTALPSNNIRMVAEPILDVVSLMETQNVVLANDTGLSHLIATAASAPMPNVVTLFAAPHADPDCWVTSPRMKPLIPPKGTTENKAGGIYCTDPTQKWINQIDPSEVAGQALASWRKK